MSWWRRLWSRRNWFGWRDHRGGWYLLDLRALQSMQLTPREPGGEGGRHEVVLFLSGNKVTVQYLSTDVLVLLLDALGLDPAMLEKSVKEA